MVVAAVLAALTLAVYWPVRGHDLVNFDDPDYVTQNPMVRDGLTLKGVIWAFTQSHSQNWHPLTWLSHMTDVQLFGMNPGAHHLVNVFFHAANTALLCLVLWRMTGALGRSAAVAALFAFHPLHVESVAWIAERKDVLSGFFWLLTLGAYARYAQSRRRRDYLLTLGLFALGLMSKPMVITLPCVLLLLDVWPLGRVKLAAESIPSPVNVSNEMRRMLVALRPLLLEKVPFLVLAITSCVVTFLAQRHGGAVVSLEHIPLGLRIENTFISYVRYLAKMVWPVDLSVYYPYPDDWPHWQAAGAALLLFGVTVVALRQWRARPWFAVGWFWYLGTLVPVIGLVQVGEQAMADRYTYLPLIGVFVMIVWGAADWTSGVHRKETALRLAGAAAVVACVLGTRSQLQVWSSSRTLFEQALMVAPSALVHVKLANALSQQGNLVEAVAEYQAALKLNPRHPGAQYNLGLTLAKQGRWIDAVAAYTEGLRYQPDHADAHNNLGVALVALGELDVARAHLTEALRFKPDDAGALNNLGNTFMAQGRFEEALVYYEQAVRRKPDNARAQLNCAVALANLERLAEAVRRFQDALRLQPDLAPALNGLAWIRATHPEAQLRNGNEAVRLAEQACALTRRQRPAFLDTLGAAYAETGRFNEAIVVAREALELATRMGLRDLSAQLPARLQSYQAGQPWRQTPL